MDYKAIYYKIIENAKKETENGKRSIGYYEKHHIQPKSLGGSNKKENLVRLTAREHFICHWLLVKMYDKGTVERNKMLCAFWRMQCINKDQKRYINSRAYEKLKIEFSTLIKKYHALTNFQKGENNSQFGTHWYTNRNTGESKRFKEKPAEYWILGKNLFHGETSSLIKLLFNKDCIKNVQRLWDEYHKGEYKSLREFDSGKTIEALTRQFRKYIPIYNKLIKRRCLFPSNKELIGIYE